MNYIECESSQNILADRQCTPSMEQIKKNLINRSFSAHQAEEMANLHTGRITPHIRHTQISDNKHDTESNVHDKNA